MEQIIKTFKGKGKKNIPLLLMHGWPGSVFEFLDIIPILTPFRWSVSFLIFAVVSCKSKRVLPQLGQEIYSVLEILVLLACSMPNANEFTD